MAVAGLVAATVGAIVSGIGMNLQKSSSRLESHKPLYKRHRYIVGVLLASILNTSLDAIAFALTPLSMIAPLAGVTIVSASLFARLGCAGTVEYLNQLQVIGIAAVVGGIAMVDLYGPHPQPVLRAAGVFFALRNSSFPIYLCTWVLVVSVFYAGFLSGKLGGKNIETTILSALAGGLSSGVAQSLLKVLAICAMDYLNYDINPLVFYDFWVVVVLLISTAFLLLHFIYICVRSAEMAFAMALYQSCVIIATIVAACALYNDFEEATLSQVSLFGFGLAFVLAGIFMLASQRRNSDHDLVSSAKEPPQAEIVVEPVEEVVEVDEEL